MRYRQKERVVSTRVEGGKRVLLRLDDGAYFALNETGAEIWEMLAETRSLGELAQALCEQFEVSPEDARREVNRFVAALEEAGMVRQDDVA